MTNTDKKLFIGLLLIGLLVFTLSRYSFFTKPHTSQAIVKTSGNIILTINLLENTETKRFTVEGKIGQAIIEVTDKKVQMYQATCPDQICVKQGWIDSPGQSIICVPNELVIYIDDNPPVDAITR
jgi:hypothetical protein